MQEEKQENNFTEVNKEQNIKRWMMNKLKIHKGQVLKEFGDKESLASLARIILKENDWRGGQPDYSQF